MDRIRTALVGCGKVGHTHAQALATLPDSDFVAACDVDLQRATAFAMRYGVKPFCDVAQMLADSRVQAVLIATPHPLHAAPTIVAARAGVHVLVEKPLAASLDDCDAMLAAARAGGIKLGVISQRRWYEPVGACTPRSVPARSAARCWACSRCIAGATRPITFQTPGAVAGTPKGAACSSTSRRT